YPYPLDWDALSQGGHSRIFHGDGSVLAYFDALYHAFIAVPEGHQVLDLSGNGCGTLVPIPPFSLRGACARPHARGVIVTAVNPTTPLGFAAGDLVVKVGETSGPAILDLLADRPICAESAPTTAFLDTNAATAFADLLHGGEQVTVESPGGAQRTFTVPDG